MVESEASEDANQNSASLLDIAPAFSFKLGYRAELFLRLLRTVKYFSSNLTLIMDLDGIESRTLNDSHTSMLVFKLDKTTFETYSTSVDRFLASLDVDEVFSKLARGLRTNKRVQLILKPDREQGELYMLFEGNRQIEYVMNFERNSDLPPETPKVDFKSRLRLNASLLRDVLEDIRIVSDRVKIVSSQEGFEFSATSNKDSAKSIISYGSHQTYEFNIEAGCEAEYDIDKIKTFLDSMRLGVVSLEFGNQAPLKISEEFRSGSYSFGYVSMYLAPIIRD